LAFQDSGIFDAEVVGTRRQSEGTGEEKEKICFALGMCIEKTTPREGKGGERKTHRENPRPPRSQPTRKCQERGHWVTWREKMQKGKGNGPKGEMYCTRGGQEDSFARPPRKGREAE